MEVKQIHKLLSGKALTFGVFIILAFLARVSAGITIYEYISWIVFIVQLCTAFLLVWINNKYQIVKKRTFLPAALFMLFTASNPVLYDNIKGTVSALIMTICLAFAFKSYHKPNSQINSFNIALILTVGSAFCLRPLLFFIPLFWIGFRWFKSLNSRTFFASLLGVFTVYLFLFAWCIYRNDWDFFYDKIPHFREMISINWIKLQWYNWVVVAYIILLLLLPAVNIFVSGLSEKIRTTLFIEFLYLLAVTLFIFICLFDSMVDNVQPVIYLSIAFISGFYFAINESKLAIYLLIFTILFFIAIYICRY